MTQILNLPLLTFSMSVSNNEDWLDSWAYVDASGNPLSLAGLVLNFEARQLVGLTVGIVIASSAPTLNGLPTNGSVVAGGAGGNVAALQIPVTTMSRVQPGNYQFEMVALGDGYTRRIATGTVSIAQGVIL